MQPWTVAPSTSRPGCFALVAGEAFFFGSGSGAVVFDVADGQPEQFDDCVVVGEVAPVLDDLAELIVQGLDRVCGVDDPAQLGWEGQEGNEPLQAFS